MIGTSVEIVFSYLSAEFKHLKQLWLNWWLTSCSCFEVSEKICFVFIFKNKQLVFQLWPLFLFKRSPGVWAPTSDKSGASFRHIHLLATKTNAPLMLLVSFADDGARGPCAALINLRHAAVHRQCASDRAEAKTTHPTKHPARSSEHATCLWRRLTRACVELLFDSSKISCCKKSCSCLVSVMLHPWG